MKQVGFNGMSAKGLVHVAHLMTSFLYSFFLGGAVFSV